jgi:ankyrin repeat protein
MATTLLHRAAAQGALDEVRIAAKASNVNVPDAAGQTALHHAASGGNPEVVKYLLNIGAQADVTDKVLNFRRGQTATTNALHLLPDCTVSIALLYI